MSGPSRHPTCARAYFNPANRWLMVGIVAIGVALILPGALLQEPKPGGPSRDENVAFAGLLATIFVTLGYWRGYRAGLYPRADGVLVVNVWWTYRVPWSEINSFSACPYAGEYRVVILNRTDGSAIPISGTAGWAPFLGERLARAPDPIAARLNALLDERRSRAILGAPTPEPATQGR